MTQHVLNILDGMGIFGLLIAMVLEGSSLPFPGVLIILTYGYLLHPNITEMMGIALGMSLAYSAASFIPYGIGWKLEKKIKKRFQKKVKKAQHWFHKYGEWSIAFTRPFGVGNYISYVAGMSRINGWKFGLLTLIGIYPWSFIMLLLGRMYKGKTQSVMQLFETFRWYIYAALALIVVCYICVMIYRRKAHS